MATFRGLPGSGPNDGVLKRLDDRKQRCDVRLTGRNLDFRLQLAISNLDGEFDFDDLTLFFGHGMLFVQRFSRTKSMLLQNVGQGTAHFGLALR